MKNASSITLAPGELQQLWAARGLRFTVLQGEALLVPAPHWLADSMVDATRRLQPGMAHEIERSGPLRWQALGHEPVCIACEAPRAPLRRLLRRLLGACARGLDHLRPLARL